MNCRHLATAVLATIFVCACASVSNADLTESAMTFSGPGGQQIEAFRGSFQVSENRENQNARQIEIGYVRFPGVEGADGPPTIYLAGGPGGSGTGAASGRRFEMFMALREFGDVIAFDQRGTGLSAHIPACGATGVHVPYDQLMTRATLGEAFASAMTVCADRWAAQGIDITGYNTRQSAADIVDLLTELGEDRVNLWGISYGTHLGFELVRQLGDERIHRIVFSGAEGPNQTIKLPARTDAYFERVEAALALHPEVGGNIPDLTDMMSAVHARLDAETPRVQIQHPETGDDIDLVFSSLELKLMAAAAIADPESIPRLFQVYSLAAQGEYEQIGNFIVGFLRTQTEVEVSGMPEFTDLASGISPERLSLVVAQAETSLFGDALNFPMPHVLGSIPEIDLGEAFRQDVSTEVPALLISGTLDGRTYPESQLEAMAGFSDLSVVTVVNGGHNLFMAHPNISTTILEFMRGDFRGDREILIDVVDAFED